MKANDELVTNCDRFRPLKHSTVIPMEFAEQGIAIFIPLNACPGKCKAYFSGAKPV
jgi:hypothetical protein